MSNNWNYPPNNYPYQSQQGSYPPPQNPYITPPPPPRKSRKGLWIALGVVGFLLFSCIVASVIGASGTRQSTNTSTANTAQHQENAPATQQQQQATPTPQHQAAWTTVQKFQGTGSKKTATFHVGDTWKLSWTCNPASFDVAYNVIVEVYNSDGTLADSAVNTTCKPGNTSDTAQEHQGGDVYLSMISEGDWTITVQELK